MARDEAPEAPGFWVEHRFISWCLRALVVVIPIAVGAAASIAVGTLIERPDGPGEIAWWAMVLAASTIAVLLTERVARKLLPLAALMRLSLIFPDKAPSRFSVAMRTMSVRRLQAWANEVTDDGSPVDVKQRSSEVLSLAAALNVHDRRTRGHSERVSALTALLCEEMGIDVYTTSKLMWGALLHDIGKLSVPKEILNKPGKPDAREWRVLVAHPDEGQRLAEGLQGWLAPELAAIGQHHEKWDGSGYPNHLEGDEIELAARIVAVADSFETMTAVRSYKKPMSVAAARTELVECSGTHFDPEVVRAFLNVSVGKLHWSVGVMAWIAQLPFLGTLPRVAAQVTTAASGSAASTTAVAGVAALVVTASVSGVGAPVESAGASVPSGAPSGQSTSVPDWAGAPDWAGTQEGHNGDALAAAAALEAPPEHSNAGGLGETLGVGRGGTPPGHGGVNPGHGGTPPGQVPGGNPGHGGTPPGQAPGGNPGHGGTPPGQVPGGNPGHGGTPPGQA